MPRIVASKGNGKCFSTSDFLTVTPMPLDVVLIPAPPAPNPVPAPPCINTADLGGATGVVSTVFAADQEVVVKPSVIPTSSGAPPNGIKGVKSPPPVNNKCEFATASNSVYADNKPLVRHRDVTKQNAGNCPGAVQLSDALDLSKPGIVIKGTLAQRLAAVRALEEVYTTPLGKELIDQLQNPAANQGHTTTVTTSSSPSACSYTAAQNPLRFATPTGPGPGANPAVNFNPADSLPGLPGADAPGIIMGHELIHAMQAMRGIQVPGLASAITPVRELQCMGLNQFANDQLTEAAMRSERGLDPRLDWSPGDTFACNRNPANIPPKGFRLGAGGKGLVYAG